MKMSHQPDIKDKETPRPSRFTVPIEDVLMPVVFIAAISIAIVIFRSWLALPFWVSCLLGIPAAFITIFGIIWLLSLISKPNQ